MKIIEALKRLKVIEKRIGSKSQDINRYASFVSTEQLAFGTETAQRAKVSEMVQSAEDLVKEYLKLKKAVERTNLEVEIELDRKNYTLSDLLVIKRKLAHLMQGVYQSLNTNAGDTRVRHAHALEGERPQVKRLFDEENKMEGLKRWQDLYDKIDSRLEVINATTDLVGSR